MYGTVIVIGIVILILAIWWKRRNGKGKVDPPSKLEELKTWHET